MQIRKRLAEDIQIRILMLSKELIILVKEWLKIQNNFENVIYLSKYYRRRKKHYKFY